MTSNKMLKRTLGHRATRRRSCGCFTKELTLTMHLFGTHALRSALYAFLLGVLTMPVAVNAAEIRVFSTPAATAALKAAIPDFERATGHKVTIEFLNIAGTRGHQCRRAVRYRGGQPQGGG